MGMFDIVMCQYKLPVRGVHHLDYQTKDFDDQYLNHYIITKDGKLLRTKYYGEKCHEYIDYTGEVDLLGWSLKTGYIHLLATFKDGKISKPIEKLEA